MAAGVGADCKAYIDTADDTDDPVWAEMAQIGDLSYADNSINLAEINIRETPWVLSLPGRFKNAIEFPLLHNPSNTVFEEIRNAYYARTPKQFAIMDGNILDAGAEGIKAWYTISQFQKDEPLDGAEIYNVRLDPAFHDDEGTIAQPAFYESVAPAPPP